MLTVPKNVKLLEAYFVSVIKEYCILKEKHTSLKSIQMYANRLRRCLGLIRNRLELPFSLDWLSDTENAGP